MAKYSSAIVPSVSNPLGWEGDPAHLPAARRKTGVSNPLGWEGDGVVIECYAPFFWFLIH